MNEIISRSRGEISVLDNLAAEAQFYARSVANSALQLGRVLIEAKKLLEHGEWEDWVAANAGCSTRYAQMFMQTYSRFGDNPEIARIADRSKIFAMLSLPAGSEEKFLAENDVSRMSARDVKQAVKAAKGEDAPPSRTKDKDELPAGIAEKLRTQQQEIERLQSVGRDMANETLRLRRENTGLKRDLAEQDDMLQEAQRERDEMQSRMLDMESAYAKGDAERAPADAFTYDIFASAVRQFMGTCARMPNMRRTFARMCTAEKNDFDELLSTIERWAQDSRAAMNAIVYEEGIINE